jgi:hypothetical protein
MTLCLPGPLEYRVTGVLVAHGGPLNTQDVFHAQHSHVGTCVRARVRCHVQWPPSPGAIYITHAIVLLSSMKTSVISCGCGTVFTTAVTTLGLAPPLSSPCPSSHRPHVATAASFTLSPALFLALFASAVLLLVSGSFHTPDHRGSFFPNLSSNLDVLSERPARNI